MCALRGKTAIGAPVVTAIREVSIPCTTRAAGIRPPLACADPIPHDRVPDLDHRIRSLHP
jgi:hypothetical protein